MKLILCALTLCAGAAFGQSEYQGGPNYWTGMGREILGGSDDTESVPIVWYVIDAPNLAGLTFVSGDIGFRFIDASAEVSFGAVGLSTSTGARASFEWVDDCGPVAVSVEQQQGQPLSAMISNMKSTISATIFECTGTFPYNFESWMLAMPPGSFRGSLSSSTESFMFPPPRRPIRESVKQGAGAKLSKSWCHDPDGDGPLKPGKVTAEVTPGENESAGRASRRLNLLIEELQKELPANCDL